MSAVNVLVGFAAGGGGAIDYLSNFFAEYGSELLWSTWETVAIVGFAMIVSYIFGIPLAMLAKITEPNDAIRSRATEKLCKVVNVCMGWVINMGRSIPYVMLMIMLMSLSRFIVGTGIGIVPAAISLAIAAIPFVVRMVENSFSEIRPGVIEAGRAFGANIFQILFKVYIKEALPSIIRGAAITCITLIGYSAISGALGNGGLGDLAHRFGYQRFHPDVMIVTIIILIIIVQVVQSVSDGLAKKIDKR